MVNQPDPRTARTRQRAAIVGGWLRRLGWSAYAIAVGAFVAGAAGRFTPLGVTLIIGALIAGSALLLPGIVIGLGVSAAEREERRSNAPN